MKFSHVFLGLLALSLPSVAADNFDWLRDDSRQDERVLSYLKKQNQKTEQFQKSYNEITQHLLSQWEAMGAEKGDKPWVIKNGQEWNLTRRQGNFVLLSRADKNAQEDVVYDFSSRQAKQNISISKLVNGMSRVIHFCLLKILRAVSNTVLCWWSSIMAECTN